MARYQPEQFMPAKRLYIPLECVEQYMEASAAFDTLPTALAVVLRHMYGEIMRLRYPEMQSGIDNQPGL